MDIKQERVKFEATFQLSKHITFDEKKNAYVSSEYRYESKAHIANGMLEAWQAAISQLSNNDGYAETVRKCAEIASNTFTKETAAYEAAGKVIAEEILALLNDTAAPTPGEGE